MKRKKLRRTSTPMHVRHKSHPILDLTNRILNISCATAKIEKLLIKERIKIQQIRPQIHVLLQSRPGSLKTTILEEIGRIHNVTSYSYASYAGMIGTVDRATGQYTPGLVWETRKKPLLLDEFKTGERGDAGATDVLLGVLESGHYKRKIATGSHAYGDKDGNLFYRIENGEIEVQTQFPCIIATMKNLDKSRSEKTNALIQRCIPIRYYLPDEVIDAVLQGSTLYKHHKIIPPSEVNVSLRDYQKIIDFTKEIRSLETRFKEVYARAVGDLCRIFATIGKHDMKLYRIVCFLKAGKPIDKAIELAEEY